MGAPGRTRTCDARFRKPTLYPLSYGGGGWQFGWRVAPGANSGRPKPYRRPPHIPGRADSGVELSPRSPDVAWGGHDGPRCHRGHPVARWALRRRGDRVRRGATRAPATRLDRHRAGAGTIHFATTSFTDAGPVRQDDLRCDKTTPVSSERSVQRWGVRDRARARNVVGRPHDGAVLLHAPSPEKESRRGSSPHRPR